MRRTPTALLSTLTVVPLLVACGTGGDDPTSAPGASEATTSHVTSPHASTSDAPSTGIPANDPPDGGPPFPEDTAGQTAKNSGKWDLVLTDVRVGQHEGFDRIVLEFTGTGIPGWSVTYVDEAVLDGSGEHVTLGGDAVLDIYASGTTYPESGEEYYSGPKRLAPENNGGVHELYVGGTFEGDTQVLAGIDGDPVPFRVFALAEPSRLVVDVVDDSAY